MQNDKGASVSVLVKQFQDGSVKAKSNESLISRDTCNLSGDEAMVKNTRTNSFSDLKAEDETELNKSVQIDPAPNLDQERTREEKSLAFNDDFVTNNLQFINESLTKQIEILNVIFGFKYYLTSKNIYKPTEELN